MFYSLHVGTSIHIRRNNEHIQKVETEGCGQARCKYLVKVAMLVWYCAISLEMDKNENT